MPVSQTILVTGGTGYIGSHTVVQLLNAGKRVIILDNLCNSKRDVISRIGRITGKSPEFIQGDICDGALLRNIFNSHQIDAVVHFAGLKAVGESVKDPLNYYNNNVSGSITLFEAMVHADVRTIVYSSSATVYGDPETVPIAEQSRLQPTNPYGNSKLVVEMILRDLCLAYPEMNVATLRYFNPVGAHASGLIGEDPAGIPNNLMPFIAQVAVGKRDKLYVFGNDYPTPDGSGVRDYIHVEDLAAGHIAAIDTLINKKPGLITVNLGTGRGYSVLEMIKTFEKISGKTIPYEFTSRRPGDIAVCYSDPSLAKALLGWEAKLDINKMCEDSWRWQLIAAAC